MSHQPVWSRSHEPHGLIRSAQQVQPDLPQAEQVEVVDQKCTDQHQPPAESEQSPQHELPDGIPGAQFIELDSKNHVLLEAEPAWERFREAVLEFMGIEGSTRGEDPAFASLSQREREVMALITEGFGNAQIAEHLSISEKTVRNHVSNLFDKLGVWTRAQAIVFARDRGFPG